MKKLTLGVAALAIATLSLVSCKKTEPVKETFTFEINGKAVDMSADITVEKNILGDLVILGKNATDGMLELDIKNTNTGTFTEADYNWNSDEFKADYDMTLTTTSSDNFSYYGETGYNFTISVNKFKNEKKGEVSGTFSGYLEANSLFNETDERDSIYITNGVFSTGLDDKIEL